MVYENIDITMKKLNKVLKHVKNRNATDYIAYQWNYLNLEEAK